MSKWYFPGMQSAKLFQSLSTDGVSIRLPRQLRKCHPDIPKPCKPHRGNVPYKLRHKADVRKFHWRYPDEDDLPSHLQSRILWHEHHHPSSPDSSPVPVPYPMLLSASPDLPLSSSVSHPSHEYHSSKYPQYNSEQRKYVRSAFHLGQSVHVCALKNHGHPWQTSYNSSQILCGHWEAYSRMISNDHLPNFHGCYGDRNRNGTDCGYRHNADLLYIHESSCPAYLSLPAMKKHK